MRCFTRRSLEALILTVVTLAPSATSAQAVATTLGGLQALLTKGDYVVVLDRSDRETWGIVHHISASELAVVRVVRSPGGTRVEITSDTRVFSLERVQLILASDPTGRKGPAIYPASWAEVKKRPAGTDVLMSLQTGERRRYRFQQATSDHLRVLTPSGRPEVLAKSDIRLIDRRSVADPSRDGAVKGAFIGTGVGLGLIAIGYATCGSCDAAERKVLYPVGAAYGAGIGAIVGWVIDRRHKGTETVFPIVSPMLSGRKKGVTVSVRFDE